MLFHRFFYLAVLTGAALIVLASALTRTPSRRTQSSERRLQCSFTDFSILQCSPEQPSSCSLRPSLAHHNHNHNHNQGHVDYSGWASAKTSNCCNNQDCYHSAVHPLSDP